MFMCSWFRFSGIFCLCCCPVLVRMDAKLLNCVYPIVSFSVALLQLHNIFCTPTQGRQLLLNCSDFCRPILLASSPPRCFSFSFRLWLCSVLTRPLLLPAAKPSPIQSRFRLTFFMLLNMLNVDRDAADVVWNSFAVWGRRPPGELQDQLQRWVVTQLFCLSEKVVFVW